MRRGALLLVCLAGCAPAAATDAGADAPLDVRVPRDVPADRGPPCELSCGLGEGCCIVEGAPLCIPLGSDLANCGACGLDCAASGRGDGCQNAFCTCGRFDIGCTGAPDVCCPTVPGGREAHCANLDVALEDCGACGQACEPGQADTCQNGRCVCEGSGRACAGLPTDTCCPTGLSVTRYRCIDTQTDREHCGSCDRRCRIDQRCEAGRCVGIFDAPPDAAGEPDAGPPDAP